MIVWIVNYIVFKKGGGVEKVNNGKRKNIKRGSKKAYKRRGEGIINQTYPSATNSHLSNPILANSFPITTGQESSLSPKLQYV